MSVKMLNKIYYSIFGFNLQAIFFGLSSAFISIPPPTTINGAFVFGREPTEKEPAFSGSWGLGLFYLLCGMFFAVKNTNFVQSLI